MKRSGQLTPATCYQDVRLNALKRKAPPYTQAMMGMGHSALPAQQRRDLLLPSYTHTGGGNTEE